MGEEFVPLDEAVSISGLSTEELEKRVADGALSSFLQEGKQVFRREDILKLKYEKTPEEEAPAEEEGIMELLEEKEEGLSLVPEEEKVAPIEVPGLEEAKKEEKAEEAEVVFEADEELKLEPPVEETAKGPVPFTEEKKKKEEEEVPTDQSTIAAEVLEELEEGGEELAAEEMRELAEQEEAPEYIQALRRPTVHPGLYFVIILSFIFLLIIAITLVSSVLGTPQSILKPFMKLFTG